MNHPVGGVVLAAGASTRAGCAKALATVRGEPLVVRCARILEEGGAHEVVVVVGPPHGDAVVATLEAGRPSGPDTSTRALSNPDPSRGMLSSLKVALAHGEARGWHAAVVLLVDQPHARAEHVAALIDAARESAARIIRVGTESQRGHPYLITRPVFGELLAARDVDGPRPVLRAVSPALIVPVDDPRVLDDVDTAAELAAAGVKPPL